MDYRQALPIGAVLAGDYKVLDVLGQGGFGLTYKAQDTRLGSPIAIKEYFPSDMALREHGATVHAKSAREEGVFAWGRQKFLEEARTLARFRHPNIVRVSRLFEENNTAYMVLDFEQGPNLAQWRDRLGRTPTQSEIDRIAVKLLDSVEAVHAAGILHRDIKPANIIMRDGYDPVLIDFGAARAALSTRSKTVHAIVTPGYSPKEQYALDVDRQGAWSDIYALGATFYYLVTGMAPADALSRDLETAMPMAADREAYRATFIEAVDAAMSVRAQDRPQTVAEWRQMLLAERAAQPLGKIGPATQAAATVVASARSFSPNVTFDQIRSGVPPQPAVARGGRGRVLGWTAASAALLGGIWYYVLVLAPAQRVRVATLEAPVAAEPNRPGAAVPPPTSAASSQAAASSAVAPPSSNAQQTTAQPASAQSSSATPQSPGGASSSSATSRVPAVFERKTLPAALPQAEIERIAQSVPSAKWRLAVGLFNRETVRGLSEQMPDFIAELRTLSGGRLTIEPITGDAAARGAEVLSQVRSQSDVMAWHTPLTDNARGRTYSIFGGAIPFGLAPADHVRWLRAEGAYLLEQTYARDGSSLRVIPCGIGGAPGVWLRKEIRTPGDLRNLKVRSNSPVLTDVLQKAGASPVSLTATENAAAAFSSSWIDAWFSGTPLLGTFLRAPLPAPVYQYPSWHQASFLMELVINPALWNVMPDGQRRLVDEACRRNLDKWATGFGSAQNDVLTQIRAQRIAVRPFTGPTLEALKKVTTEVLVEESTRNAEFKDVLDSYNRFQR